MRGCKSVCGKGYLLICEYQKDAQAEVLVFRQATRRTSGFYTKDDRCAQIL
jgi:hypothetical protein